MPATMTLTANLDTKATGALAADLAGITAETVLDAGSVTHVGALAAQVLLAARKSGVMGHAVTVGSRSIEFDDGMRRLGIDPETFA